MQEAIDRRLGPSHTLHAALGPSHTLSVALAVAHLLALAALWRAVPWIFAAPVSLALLCSGTRAIGRHGLRTRADAVVSLATSADGVRLGRRDGGMWVGQVEPDSIVLPGLVIVRVASGGWGRGQAVVIPADCTGRASHRCLRVYLRWGRHGKSPLAPARGQN